MYFPILPVVEKPTTFQMMEKGRRFIESDTLPQLAACIGIKEDTLLAKAKNQQYQQFYMPKGQGEKRLIETPEAGLKTLQGQLNKHFQAAYLMVRPACAYGSLIACSDETEPRNIYTNAMRHIGSRWLLNVDLRNFFPSIGSRRVLSALQTSPFHFDDRAATALTLLTTHENRLPTGAPSSPIIANIVCLPLDTYLQQLADEYGWNYTRYIDDLTFSSEKRFDMRHLSLIEKGLKEYGLAINTDKLRMSRVSDKPVVTGLVLRKKRPDVSPEFIKNLKRHIRFFRSITSDDMLKRQLFSAALVQRYRAFIRGQLQFIQFIRGEGDATYLKLARDFEPRTW